jgi:hypothetical protein
LRTCLPLEDSNKQVDFSAILQLVQDMNTIIIYFEKRMVNQLVQEISAQVFLHNQNQTCQPKTIISHALCNFCEENHEESTSELTKNAQERDFVKRPNSIVATLDWVLEDDVMLADTRNRSYFNKN